MPSVALKVGFGVEVRMARCTSPDIEACMPKITRIVGGEAGDCQQD